MGLMMKIRNVLVACLFWAGAAFADSQTGEMSFSPFPENYREAIDAYNDIVINKLGPKLNVQLGYNDESIAWLDGFLQRYHVSRGDQDAGKLADMLGAFYGEALIRKYGGEWLVAEGGEAVIQLQGDLTMFPLSAVRKQMKNGAEDSVAHMYHFTGEMLTIIELREKGAETEGAENQAAEQGAGSEK